jgi:hypothetical protein
LAESGGERDVEEAAVSQRATTDGFSGFAFCFLVGCVDAVEISVAELPGQVQMRPNMMQHLLELSLTREFERANFIVVINVVLLDLNPVMAEASPKQMGPSDAILAVDEDSEA